MKEKISIEEQVAQLTPAQQDTILKIGKIASIIIILVDIPLMLSLLYGIYCMIDPPLFVEMDHMKMGLGIMIEGVIIAVLNFAGALFIKVQFPYYSDAKYTYIKKMRKKK